MQGHGRMIKVFARGGAFVVREKELGKDFFGLFGFGCSGCNACWLQQPKTEEESTGYPEPGSKGTIVLATTTSFRDSA